MNTVWTPGLERKAWEEFFALPYPRTLRIRLPADYKQNGTPMPDIEPNPARKDFDLFAILEHAIENAHTAHDLVALSQEYRALIRDNEDWLKNA